MEKQPFDKTKALTFAKELIAKLDEAQLSPEESQEVEGGISCFTFSCDKANANVAD